MSELNISLNADTYKPGATLSGHMQWSTDELMDEATFRLGWRTSGIGTEDIEIVEIWKEPVNATSGTIHFEHPLPVFPYSFSGELITLTWFLEASFDSINTSDVIDILITPQDAEIRLHATSS